MSTLAQHKRHLGALHDIRDIMAALKNISLTESQRMRRFLETQQRVVAGIERAMGDFLAHYPRSLPDDVPDYGIILLIGSERGFCGDFNERVLDSIKSVPATNRTLIAVGEKLGGKLAEEGMPAQTMAGLTTVEDVPGVLLAAADMWRELSGRLGATQLTIVHHCYDGHAMEVRATQPFRDLVPDATHHGYAPTLNVAPAAFFPELMNHYLFAVLHDALYSSLAAEHQQRLQHLQGAIEHLDRQSAALMQRYNNLRQELITEEIELIVLSAGAYLQQ